MAWHGMAWHGMAWHDMHEMPRVSVECHALSFAAFQKSPSIGQSALSSPPLRRNVCSHDHCKTCLQESTTP
eukprot:10055297-Lingulodinium_polyedra.AAC.1